MSDTPKSESDDTGAKADADIQDADFVDITGDFDEDAPKDDAAGTEAGDESSEDEGVLKPSLEGIDGVADAVAEAEAAAARQNPDGSEGVSDDATGMGLPDPVAEAVAASGPVTTTVNVSADEDRDAEGGAAAPDAAMAGAGAALAAGAAATAKADPAPSMPTHSSAAPAQAAPQREVVRETVVEKKGGFVPGLIGGLVGGAAILFGAPYVLPGDLLPQPNLGPVESRLAETETVANQATQQLADLTPAIEGAAPAADLQALAGRVDGLDEATTGLAGRIEALDTFSGETRDAIEALTGQTAALGDADNALQQRISDQVGAATNDLTARAEGLQAAIADISREGEAAAQQVRDLLARIDALEKRPIAESNDALAAAAVGAYSREMAALRDEVAAAQAAAAETLAQAQQANEEAAALAATTRDEATTLATEARDEAIATATAARDEAAAMAAEARDAATALAEEVRAEAQALAASTREETASVIAAAKEEVAATAAAARSEVEAQARAAQEEAEAQAAAAAEAASLATQKQALAEVRAALNDGAPFAEALAVITDFEVPAGLSAVADSGVETLETLQDRFGPAARDALDAARDGVESNNPSERGLAFLQRQLGVRSLAPRDGESPDAVLSRAQAAVNEGRLTDAIAEIGDLPDIASAELADWIAQAQTRADAEAAADALSADMAAN